MWVGSTSTSRVLIYVKSRGALNLREKREEWKEGGDKKKRAEWSMERKENRMVVVVVGGGKGWGVV